MTDAYRWIDMQIARAVILRVVFKNYIFSPVIPGWILTAISYFHNATSSNGKHWLVHDRGNIKAGMSLLLIGRSRHAKTLRYHL